MDEEIGFDDSELSKKTTVVGVVNRGRTESDATHIRLRSDIHSKKIIKCKSCEQTFESFSRIQINEHYSECEHLRYFSKCFYCQGKVHQYVYTHSPEILHIYHNCLRWKRGEEK